VLSQHKPFHILIVDNSPDHTADKVRLLQTEFGGRLFWKTEKEVRFGNSLCSWVQMGIREKDMILFEMDADFSHNPND
jgi:dolichol-phosphate mannosyltransferase